MFGIGTTELMVIGFIVLILFGSRLPSVMGSLGVGINKFKQGMSGSLDDEDKSAA